MFLRCSAQSLSHRAELGGDNAQLQNLRFGLLWNILAAGLLAVGMALLKAGKIKYNFAALNACLFLLTLALIGLHADAWAAHHFAPALTFLLLAFFYLAARLYKQKLFAALLAAFLAVNVVLYLQLGRLRYQETSHPALPKLNQMLNASFADDHVFIVVDWGIYYLKALYGNKDQCVLYYEPLRSVEQTRQIKTVLNFLKRKALFIGLADSESDLRLITKEFPGLKQLEPGFDTGRWRVWYQE